MAARLRRSQRAFPWKTTLLCSLLLVILLFWALRLNNDAQSLFNKSQQGNKAPRSSSVLPVNMDSTIAQDIEYIRHDEIHSLIHIQLKQNARCKSPVFGGRLSGPALVMLEWTRHNTTTLYGHYTAPLSGTYFVEIIIFLCQEFYPRQNFTETCLEDPLRHGVTRHDAAIQVDTSSNARVTGYWVKQQHSLPKPLYTRFQPQHCRWNDTAVNTSYCQEPMNVDRFDGYEWVTNIDYYSPQHDNSTAVCLIGASHSGVLYRFMQNVTTTPVYMETAKFPNKKAILAIRTAVTRYNCTQVVIGMGQWSAGWPDKRPALFHEFQDDMRTLLQRALKAYPSVQLFVRSMHYNPIGDIIGSCPPHDWRSPPVIDGYNQVLKQLTLELNIPFIDTNHIIGPMWDSAPDWCHFRNSAGEEEARYMAWYLSQQKTSSY